MTTEIITKEEAREKIKKIVNVVADIVGVTMGAKGRNVLVTNERGTYPSKDGDTVLNSIKPKNDVDKKIVGELKKGSRNTNEEAGDGTTAYMVLTKIITNEGFKNVTAGTDPLAIKRGIDKGVQYIIEKLKKMSKKITSRKQIEQIASVSATDSDIGKIIAEATEKVGKEGVITIEKGDSYETTSEVVEGLSFDRGVISPYLSTELTDPYILLTDKKIDSIVIIKEFLEKIATSEKKKVVIIADDIVGEGLGMILVNKGVVNSMAVKSPGFIDKNELLEDLAALTGAKIVSEHTGLSLDTVELKDLGTAKKVISGRHLTTIVDGGGTKKAINKRRRLIRQQLKEVKDVEEKLMLESRLAKLVDGIGIIKVGGSTEAEVLEKRDRIEDSLNASKSALEQGIVIGGGMALILASKGLWSLNLPSDEMVGVRILMKSIEQPFKQIVDNAGEKSDVILDKVMMKSKNFGYNVKTGKVEDMFKAGIVDATKVIISSLKYASSTASMLITLEGLIVDEEETKPL